MYRNTKKEEKRCLRCNTECNYMMHAYIDCIQQKKEYMHEIRPNDRHRTKHVIIIGARNHCEKKRYNLLKLKSL
jgi:hypothetical protein